MHYGCEVVHADPAGILDALHVQGRLAELFFQPFVNIVRNGLHLRVRIPFADNEKVRWGIVQFSEVKFHDVFSFDVLDAVDNEVVQLFHRGEISF